MEKTDAERHAERLLAEGHEVHVHGKPLLASLLEIIATQRAEARGRERARIATRLRTRADSLDALGGNSYASMILRAEADAFSEDDVYIDARGKRHSRGCDVAVYDDTYKPCSRGCNANPSAAALRTDVDTKDVMLRLPHGETTPGKLYNFPNPDTLIVAFRALNQEVYLFADDEQRSRDRVTVSYDHVAYVLMLAHAYLDLTMYELGQECCVKKLRDIWRARRAAAKE